MIDLHCHLLPGIDDGAPTIEVGVELARMAVEDGIKCIVLTPHIHPGRFDNTPEIIRNAFSKYKAAIELAELPVKLKAAAEVHLCPELMLQVEKKQVPFLGQWQGKKVLLLELPHSHIPPGTDNLIRWLKSKNIIPMIAHPERNKAIMADMNKLSMFINEGCLFQLTAMSVAGKFGAAAHEVALEMLSKGWATVIATDAHNATRRPPILSEAFSVATELLGEVEAKKLVWDNPALILGLKKSESACEVA